MQRSIEKSETYMERMMDAKIWVVYNRLDAFEQRVLKRYTPTIDVTIQQTELARLCFDVDALLAPVEIVQKTTPEDRG